MFSSEKRYFRSQISEMKGLKLFLNGLINCKDKNEEMKKINKELANIRNKFKGDKFLNGYQKRKYVCKLVYIILLGYECEFGLTVAIDLLSSNVYYEKQVGYLFISVVKGDDCNIMPLVANAVKTDLSSNRDVFQNWALQFIANKTSLSLVDCFADPVLKLLLSSDTISFVKQSAAFALLQLLRIKSDFVLTEDNVICLINLISHHDLGVATASSSLIEFLVKTSPTKYHFCASHCIVQLSKNVSRSRLEFSDCTYPSVVAPWMCVKLLRILQNFPAPSEGALQCRLKDSLEIILRKDKGTLNRNATFENINAKYAVIFEAISLIIKLEFEGHILSRAFAILESTLKSKEINLRFTALEIVNTLSSNVKYVEHVKPQWKTILKLLTTETDLMIKKRAVNLLYIICSAQSVKPIVCTMLSLLEKRDNFSQEIMLQTAATAEQFGDDHEWYISTIFNLFQICGDKISDSVWHSLVKVVIKNDDAQEYAAKASYAVLCDRSCHVSLVNIAGYILGEFGYLIASIPQSNYKLQFNILKERYYNCPPSTKALLLTTFMKFLNIYPDIKQEVQIILKDECVIHNKNEEIQQRAVEYLKLTEIAFSDLLAIVLEPISPSIREVSATVTAMKKSHEMCSRQKNRYRKGTLPTTRLNCDINNVIGNTGKETMHGTSVPAVGIPNISNNESFLYNMLFKEQAKLYENDIITVFIESEFNKRFGTLHMNFLNKTTIELSELSIGGNFTSIKDHCSIWYKPCNSILPANGIMNQYVHLECLSVFTERPYLNFKFTSMNRYYEVKLIMPLTLNKFVEPRDMTADAFAERWQKFKPSASHQEVIKEFVAKYPMIYGVTRNKLEGFRLAIIGNGDSENFHCSGTFYTREKQIGFLVQLERYILNSKYCCRVRSSHYTLSHVISDLIGELL